MSDIITNKIDTALEGNYHSLISVDKVSIHNIINMASKNELFNFLTLEEKSDPDYTLKKTLILNNIINNIINNQPEIITNNFNDHEIIKIVKSFDFYNTSFILNIFNHISSEHKVDFLNSQVENSLFSANNFSSHEKEYIIDLIIPEYFSLSNINNKKTFDDFYNLNLDYFNNDDQIEISSKLKEKNLKLFINMNRIDFYGNKSIDLFFMNKDWFSNKYDSRFDNDRDGLDFLIHSFNSCSTENNLSYMHKKLNQEINEDNKELINYLKEKKSIFIEKLLSSPNALPLNSVVKKLFTENFQILDETPLLIKFPQLILEKNFLSNLNFFVKNNGLKKLIGDKTQQQKIADFLLNINSLGYFFKDNYKANNMQKISIKLLDVIKKENIESSHDLIFFFTILSKSDNKNKLEVSHFSPEIFYDELEKNLNKPFIKKLFLYFGDDEKEKLNKIILISKEKSKIIESISDQEPNTLKQNNKRL